ncbi:small ribosomal subunit Rsm22 family protein [Aestuariivirga sp.]|uniref:small ribosomal subunit Rsm22 family protein n=1 Tax=Aestuariivirga sp. TaxID=2650926 RepID=UPI0039E215BF
MALPDGFSQAVERWLAEAGRGGARGGARQLSTTYRAGGTSEGIDLAAYLVTRLPATYAAVSTVLSEVQRLRPAFAPKSLVDAGSGPGTAAWAASACWSSLEKFELLDNNRDFLTLAQSLALEGGLAGMKGEMGSLLHAGAKADLVIAAYALAEIPLNRMPEAADALWARAQETLVLVEPGTPSGFARIRATRERLLRLGASVIGPCPHENTCPLEGADWCHFSVRLPRSRAHMHAKAATVPFEDEKFAWAAFSRERAAASPPRIIAPPVYTKAALALRLCTEQGIAMRHVPRRDKDAFRSVRHLGWGDTMGSA